MSKIRIAMRSLMSLTIFLFCVKTGKVTEVIDGDTFKTGKGETVRLLGINAPEMADPGGDIAKDYLTMLILNKNVHLEKDLSDKDDYSRILRYVHLGNKLINGEMVRTGYAEARFYPPDTLHKRELLELEKIAIRNRRGLWSFAVFQVPDTTDIAAKEFIGETIKSEIISWQEAGKYYGKTKTVEGKIIVSNNTGKVCFLNFHKDWKKYFTAVIFSSDFDKFPPNPEDYYLNRKVRVTGLIKEYKDKPEIIIKSTAQIEIIE